MNAVIPLKADNGCADDNDATNKAPAPAEEMGGRRQICIGV